MYSDNIPTSVCDKRGIPLSRGTQKPYKLQEPLTVPNLVNYFSTLGELALETRIIAPDTYAFTLLTI